MVPMPRHLRGGATARGGLTFSASIAGGAHG